MSHDCFSFCECTKQNLNFSNRKKKITEMVSVKNNKITCGCTTSFVWHSWLDPLYWVNVYLLIYGYVRWEGWNEKRETEDWKPLIKLAPVFVFLSLGPFCALWSITLNSIEMLNGLSNFVRPWMRWFLFFHLRLYVVNKEQKNITAQKRISICLCCHPW